MGKALEAVHVVGVRYRQSQLAKEDERSLDGYLAANLYDQLPHHYVEPRLPDAERVDNEPDNIGLLCGHIADEVSAGLRDGRGVLMTGADCNHMTAVFGGLQDAYGSNAKIGLVWFDAHGDFNTPRTSLSGMLGGMPVAVAAGLAFPRWRESAHIVSPLPTNRIVMVDVRNLDPAEEQLVRATDVTIARVADGYHGDMDLETAVSELAQSCDIIYFHIDADILDERYVPNHGTREPNGPNMDEVTAAIQQVMATGKVAAYAVVSVYGAGEGRERSLESGKALISAGLQAWRKHGLPDAQVKN